MAKTYATLQTAIADYANRSDLTSPIQDAIEIVQRQLERDNDWKCMRAKQTGTVTTDSPYLAYPTRYKNTHSLFILQTDNAYVKMMQNRIPWGHVAYPYVSDETALPELFSEDDSTSSLLLRPTPDDDYDYVWYYHQFLESVSTATSSWWLTNAWELLLYGSLVELSPYLKDDERIPIWQGMYDRKYKTLRDMELINEASGSEQFMQVPMTLV